MTLPMYAERKGWPLDAVAVRLRHDRVHANDCAECESRPAMIESIDRAIDLRGPLTDEQRSRLLGIADRAPCTGQLETDIQITTKLLDPAP